MKKMLAKAVALSLVLGGVGFVANDALAAEIGFAVDVETIYGDWDKVLSYNDGQAINAEVATNKANIDTNKANIAKNAENISANQKAIDKEVKDRQDAITQERNARTVAELNLGEQITQEKNARVEADNKLGEDIKANKEAIKNEEQARKYDSLILGDNITQEKNARIDADKAEAATRKDADTKLQANIEKETADRIAGDNVLNSRINQVESDANKGIAKASALAALHPLDYDPDNKFDIAAAGGFYKGENAFALGAFYRPNRNVMLSMGTTLTSGDNAYNVGVTFKIGKSGKHTETGLTTADLYAMIGAMQDKMDQQQKKIEELEAKQAK